jgi:hypothetical protein
MSASDPQRTLRQPTFGGVTYNNVPALGRRSLVIIGNMLGRSNGGATHI